jgi:transcriptional regulator with XRE-family HTH domain
MAKIPKATKSKSKVSLRDIPLPVDELAIHRYQISRRIIAIRNASLMTQAEFSRVLRIEPKTMSQYERARIRPGYEQIILIANECNVTTDFILRGITKGMPRGSTDDIVRAMFNPDSKKAFDKRETVGRPQENQFELPKGLKMSDFTRLIDDHIYL